MSDRRHEIAVMRALGASRGTVMSVILLESILLSLAGGVGGWLSGHALNWLASGEIERRSGVSVGFFDMAPPLNVEIFGLNPIIGRISPELFLIPALVLLAVLVGLLPAMSAYRTDVAKSLGA
jgi:putative ABC transport system permease protein